MQYSDNTISSKQEGFSLPFFVQEFWNEMGSCPDEFGPEIWAVRNLIDTAFEREDLIVDLGLAQKYFSLEKYLPYELMPIQRCSIGLHLCVFRAYDGMPRWPDLYIIAARGCGKDGWIMTESFFVTSPYNIIDKYDVDICAVNEEQAMRPVDDLREMLENPDHTDILKKFWYWTKEVVQGRANLGKIKGRTNNPKGRDGMRSGMIIFNEKHAYTDYKNIEVFETGLGKKEHPRSLTCTTDGSVVDGPLDNDKKKIQAILDGTEPDKGLLPFVFRINSDEEIHDETAWRRANPRLKRSPSLMQEYRKQYEEWKIDPDKHTSFPTKRLNLRKVDQEQAVTSWENIIATNRPLPDLTGKACICGIDYSKSNDWIGVNLHFNVDDTRYEINHAFVCTQGNDFVKLACPIKEWQAAGHVTFIDSPDIPPQIIADYIREMRHKYKIVGVAIDDYRWTLMSEKLEPLGYSLKRKTLKLIRPSDIIKAYPIINSLFVNQKFVWGDNPVLRWACNNTKLIPAKKSATGDADCGNYKYDKIEPIRRKTDPFMAMVHSVCFEEILPRTSLVKKEVKRIRPAVF